MDGDWLGASCVFCQVGSECQLSTRDQAFLVRGSGSAMALSPSVCSQISEEGAAPQSEASLMYVAFKIYLVIHVT